MGRVLGEAAPSMFMSVASQTTAFYLGALSDMPAVRAFALYAATALLINFIMQVTAFIALLALDDAREKLDRYDVLCCFKAKPTETKKNTGLIFIFGEHKWTVALRGHCAAHQLYYASHGLHCAAHS
jgi:Niemann-Pick C1 protein